MNEHVDRAIHYLVECTHNDPQISLALEELRKAQEQEQWGSVWKKDGGSQTRYSDASGS